MSAGKLDLEIEQGTEYRRTLIWKTQDTVPQPINLTGASARMQIRDKQQGTVFVEASTTNGKIALGTTNGVINIALTEADTTSLNKRRLKYDLEIWSPTIPKSRVIEGNVFVSPNITQDRGEPVVT